MAEHDVTPGNSTDQSHPAEVIAIVTVVTDLAIPFRARRIAGDPVEEIRKTRRMTDADLDSTPVRLARVRYWVAQGYLWHLIAHELYPHRFPHPGEFDAPERLARVEEIYTRHYGSRHHYGFAARMAEF